MDGAIINSPKTDQPAIGGPTKRGVIGSRLRAEAIGAWAWKCLWSWVNRLGDVGREASKLPRPSRPRP